MLHVWLSYSIHVAHKHQIKPNKHGHRRQISATEQQSSCFFGTIKSQPTFHFLIDYYTVCLNKNIGMADIGNIFKFRTAVTCGHKIHFLPVIAQLLKTCEVTYIVNDEKFDKWKTEIRFFFQKMNWREAQDEDELNGWVKRMYSGRWDTHSGPDGGDSAS